ncbi:MAG: MerR family DNA-binding transcriptional regulator [Sedimenticola sp.]|nr:MerR family DNA-binding transcriptional regulator [Sedimenticola sp.]
MDKLLTVTELAEEFNITPRTIRFYETKELISPQRVGQTRVYSYRDRARLKLILRAKRLGFSLTDIREYLGLYGVDPEQLEQQQLLLEKVGRRIEELEQQQEDLVATLEELRDIQRQALSNLKKHGAATAT